MTTVLEQHLPWGMEVSISQGDVSRMMSRPPAGTRPGGHLTPRDPPPEPPAGPSEHENTSDSSRRGHAVQDPHEDHSTGARPWEPREG